MHNDSKSKLNHAFGKPKQINFTEVSLALRYTCPTYFKTYKIKDKFILTLMSDHIPHTHIGFCTRNDINRHTVSNDLTW
jgi:hypothetical protein